MPSAPQWAPVIALALVWIAFLLLLPPDPSSWIVFLTGLPLVALVSWTAARRAQEEWIPFLRARLDWHALALILLFSLGVLLDDAHGITTDGAIYFSQLRSLIFDRDLEISREFELLGQPPRPHHVVPIGPTLVWLPLYATVALVDAIGRAIGLWSSPADPALLGLGPAYVRAALISSFAAGAVGLFAVYARLRREFVRGVSFAAVVLLFGATSLFWYMVYEPAMTHAVSFGCVALFVVLADRWIPRGVTRREAITLGALLGLAVLSRPQEALFVLVPVFLMFDRRAPFIERLREAVYVARWGFIGALPLLLLQALHGYALLSRYRFRVAGDGGYLRLFDSQMSDVLFSSWHGFLSWTPVAYVAVLGTIAYLRRNRRWAAAALLILVSMAWINGAAEDWSGGWSFGGRRFTSMLVMLAPGLAFVIDVLRRRPLLALAPAIVAALMWNYLLMVQYTTGLVPKDEPVSFGRLVRQQAEVRTRSPYLYPFAFPANVWFAWREGLPVDRYDLLAPEPRRQAIELVMDRRADRFLLEGWDAPGGDDFGPVWWIGGREASLAVPLDLPAGRDVATVVLARARHEEPEVRATLSAQINGHEVGTFDVGASSPSEARIIVPASAFGQVWRSGYNRVTFISRGVHRVDPSDARPPGPIASRPGSRAWPVAIYRIQIAPAP